MARKAGKATRTSGGQFAKGASGNPAGRPRKDANVPETLPLAKLPTISRRDGWQNFFSGHGVHGRDKKIGAHFTADRLTFEQCAELWRGDDLAARAVETLPHEALREGYDIVISDEDGTEQDEGGKSAVEKIALAVAKLDDLRINTNLEIAACNERGYGGGALLIGANDGCPDLSQPLDMDRVKSIDWVTTLEARELQPLYGYSNPRAKKFGETEIYQLVPRSVLPSKNGGSFSELIQIHESRLIVFPGIRVSRFQSNINGGWGDAVLNRVWRVLRDFNMSWSSAGTLVVDFAQAVYAMEGLWEALAEDQDGALSARLNAMELARSSVNATVIDSKDQYSRQQTPVSGLPELLDKFATRLAAACDMPLTLLFGTSPGGLNATGASDVRFFYDRVASYQQQRLKPALRKLIEIIFRTTGDRSIPKNWELQFRPLWQDTAQEQATSRLTQAQTDQIYLQLGVLGADEVAASRFGSGKYSFDTHVDKEARENQEAAIAGPVTAEDKAATTMPPDGTPGAPTTPGAPPPAGPPGAPPAHDPAPGPQHLAPTHPPMANAAHGPAGVPVPAPDVSAPDPGETQLPPGAGLRAGVGGVHVGQPQGAAAPSGPPEHQTPHAALLQRAPNGGVKVGGQPQPQQIKRDYSPDQERDEGGRFSSGGGGSSGSTSTSAGAASAGHAESAHAFHLHEPNAKELMAKAAESEAAGRGAGFSYDPATGHYPTEGFAVSIHPGHEQVFDGKAALDDAHLEAYCKAKESFFANNPGAHIGGWYDTSSDRWYLDVSHVETSKVQAVKLAQEHHQLGIYDLKEGRTIGESEYAGILAAAKTDSAGRRTSGVLRSSQDVSKGHGGEDARDPGRGTQGGRAPGRLDYSPDQPRAENGEFGEGGGGGSDGHEPKGAPKQASKHSAFGDVAGRLESARQRGALPKNVTPEQQRTIAERVADAHATNLPAARAELRSLVDGRISEPSSDKETKAALDEMIKTGHGDVLMSARTKDVDSMLDKITRYAAQAKPGEKSWCPTADNLTDSTGMRLIAPTLDGINKCIATAKEHYHVIEENNYQDKPQPGGYRAVHLLVTNREGLTQEIQFQTARQQKFQAWSHDVYKPQNATQSAVKEGFKAELAKYADAMSKHYYDLDRGLESTLPPPPSDAIVKAFGKLDRKDRGWGRA